MNKIDKNQVLDKLYDAYHLLLSDKNQDIYEMYYFDDYSINEIADINQVSKTAIFNSLQKIEKQLFDWEDKLHVVSNYQKLDNYLQQHNTSVSEIIGSGDE